MDSIQQRKLLSALSHGAVFFSSMILPIVIPIAILVLSEDPIVKENAKEALNFHISFYIYFAICLLLSLVLVGIFLFMAVVVFTCILPIIAIIRVLNEPNIPYRYPFIFRVVR